MHGRAAFLIDGLTGQVLFDYNGSVRNFPASTTKLLTALVAVEHGRLDQVIKVSARAIDQAPDSSSCYLNLGEEQKLEYLLHGLLLASGNDCAVAIAEGISKGDSAQFSAWMNETAHRIGATQSAFTNPHGLHDPEHYTTASDLALIARAALADPIVQKIAGTREFNWPSKSNGTYYNHNAMLFTYDGSIGGKTGFTEQAGLTLVSAAKRDGRTLIGVVMGEDFKTNQYGDMKALLDYGFAEFEHKVAVAAGTPQGNISVLEGRKEVVAVATQNDVVVSVPKGAEPRVTLERKFEGQVKAPIQVGRPVGTLEVRDGNILLATVPVTAREAIEAKPPVLENLRGWGLSALRGLGLTIIGLLAFRTIVKGTRRLLRIVRRRSKGGRSLVTRRNTGEIAAYRVRNRT